MILALRPREALIGVLLYDEVMKFIPVSRRADVTLVNSGYRLVVYKLYGHEVFIELVRLVFIFL